MHKFYSLRAIHPPLPNIRQYMSIDHERTSICILKGLSLWKAMREDLDSGMFIGEPVKGNQPKTKNHPTMKWSRNFSEL